MSCGRDLHFICVHDMHDTFRQVFAVTPACAAEALPGVHARAWCASAPTAASAHASAVNTFAMCLLSSAAGWVFSKLLYGWL